MSVIPWWRHSVVYQVYIRSFADGNGDGTGDITGLRSRLPYLHRLGVDAIWVNPWYESPLHDGGYDVSNYRQIDPAFGTIAQARSLFEEAGGLGMRVLVDLVPNHTSSEHAWFKQALGSAPGSPERNRYHFLPGKGHNGQYPPNNWQSVFGGPAWSRVPDGDWYLHMFDATQPDLNWANSEVRHEFRDLIRFWLDIGAAGFRVDVAHAIVKEPGYPDAPENSHPPIGSPHPSDHPLWDRPGLHEIIREWRSVLDEYEETVMVAEAWLADWSRLALFVRSDEYHQVFDFDFLKAPWDAEVMRDVIDRSLGATEKVGSIPSWVLANHDVVRQSTRYGLPKDVEPADWLLAGNRELLDEHTGLRRARAAVLLMLALPGSVYLYQGEELGLPEVHDLPEVVLEDPVWERSGHSLKGRDGCRVPIPWTTEGDSYGFGENGSWLPQPDTWASFSVASQESRPDSTLTLYRRALAIRKEHFTQDEDTHWLELGSNTLAFARGNGATCVVNFGLQPLKLPPGQVLVASGPIDGGDLPVDTAAWILPNS